MLNTYGILRPKVEKAKRNFSQPRPQGPLYSSFEKGFSREETFNTTF